jgi:hypothetical protein
MGRHNVSVPVSNIFYVIQNSIQFNFTILKKNDLCTTKKRKKGLSVVYDKKKNTFQLVLLFE